MDPDGWRFQPAGAAEAGEKQRPSLPRSLLLQLLTGAFMWPDLRKVIGQDERRCETRTNATGAFLSVGFMSFFTR